MEEVVIIGGGVAGLSCLNALADQGIKALLLEGGQIGHPRMCGEFLAPAAVAALEKWDIGPLQSIHKIKFTAQQKELALDFPYKAGAFSRSKAELLLAARAMSLGSTIRENTKVTDITPASATEAYEFQLSDGNLLKAKFAIFAAGKAVHAPGSALPYYGIKTSIPRVFSPDTLLMHSLPGAYMGVVAVDDYVSNCAGLITRTQIEKNGSLQQWFVNLLETNVFFKEVFDQVPIYLEAKAPHFGLKKTFNWPRSLWIGDTIVNLPPAIGSGFAHSVVSGILAAECYGQQDFRKYKNVVSHKKLLIGKILHKLLLTPNYSFLLQALGNKAFLTNYIFKILYECSP